MKAKSILSVAAVLGVVAMSTGAAMATPEACKVSTSVDLAVVSKYVWRGLVLNEDPAFQPSITFSHPSGLSFNLWGSMDLTDAGEDIGYGDKTGNLTEIDYTLAYTGSVSDYTWSAGFVKYTFPHTYMKPLVDDGHIYIAQPPFYRIKAGKDKVFYAKNDVDRDAILRTLGNKKDVIVTRFKGLGEMDAVDLADTTMSVENRTIALVTVEDAVEADEMFTVLLGDAVEPRKAFIEAHAKETINVDWHA